MYGLTNDKVQKVTQSFPVAVNNVCKLEKCEYVTKGEKNLEAIDFVYVMDRDNDITYRQIDTRFAVNPDSVTPRGEKSYDEMLEQSYKNFNTILKHIATKFNCTEAEMANLNTSSFRNYATDFCNMIMSKVAKSSPDLYCKTYRDANGYSKVGKYVPFLQRVDEGDCMLNWTKTEVSSNNMTHANGIVKNAELEENYIV